MRPSMHFIRWALGVAVAETATTSEERAALARHARGSNRLVEIGVWHGVTTRVLRAAMRPDGELWAVDPYPRGRLGLSLPRVIARREVAGVRNGTVRWVRQRGVEAAQMYRASGLPPVDLLFVDGDHTYEAVDQEWRAWRPLVALGGVVAFHDSRDSGGRPCESGSARLVRDIVTIDASFELVDAVDSLTALRRICDTE